MHASPEGVPGSGKFTTDVIHLDIAVIGAILFINRLRKYGSELIEAFHYSKVWYISTAVLAKVMEVKINVWRKYEEKGYTYSTCRYEIY